MKDNTAFWSPLSMSSVMNSTARREPMAVPDLVAVDGS